MNKIRVIDLLNKIANEEEVPKRIKYYGEEFAFTGYDSASKNYNNELEDLFEVLNGSMLNDEVEILEEEPYVEVCGRWFTKSEYDEFIKSEEEKKIPEKLKMLRHSCNFDRHEETLYENQVDLANKITEILDYLKSKGE